MQPQTSRNVLRILFSQMTASLVTEFNPGHLLGRRLPRLLGVQLSAGSSDRSRTSGPVSLRQGLSTWEARAPSCAICGLRVHMESGSLGAPAKRLPSKETLPWLPVSPGIRRAVTPQMLTLCPVIQADDNQQLLALKRTCQGFLPVAF